MRIGLWLRVLGLISLMLAIEAGADSESASMTSPNSNDEIGVELDNWRTFRRALKTTDQPEASFTAHWAAAARCLYNRSVEILGEQECAALKNRLHQDEVHRVFIRNLVRPRVIPNDAEVENAVRQTLTASAKPEGIRVLEIFVWAPRDLPVLRDRQHVMLEELEPKLRTADDFREAAQRFSDGTSAEKKGQIGILYKDKIPEILWEHLQNTKEGLTPILETAAGFFRFYVLERHQARSPNAEDLAPRIRNKMIANRIRTGKAAVLAGLQQEFDVEIARPAPLCPDDRAALIAGQAYLLSELLPNQPNTGKNSEIEVKISRAVDFAVMELALEKAGFHIVVPFSREVVALAQRVLEKLETTEMSTPERNSEVKTMARYLAANAPTRQLWSFDIVRVVGVENFARLSELFRIRHDAGEHTELATLARQIQESTNLEVTVEPFTKVGNRKVAGLGPEVHQTLLLRSSAGTISRPLHLADRKEAVFVRLNKVDEDNSDHFETALAAAQQKVRAQTQEELIQHHASRCTTLQK